MDFFEVVEKRQSVRKYATRPIEPEKLNRILEAANRAPSAGNFQSFEIYVVQGEDQIKALTAVTFGQDFVAQAPLSIVFCTNPSRCEYQPAETFALEDATIACTFAMMAVTALGLSSCWVGAFVPAKVAEVVGCKQNVMPMAILSIGYAAEEPERTSRRQLSDLVQFIQ
jgi:nitroreductase